MTRGHINLSINIYNIKCKVGPTTKHKAMKTCEGVDSTSFR